MFGMSTICDICMSNEDFIPDSCLTSMSTFESSHICDWYEDIVKIIHNTFGLKLLKLHSDFRHV